MQDDGDEAAEARLTITSVRSTPPGYTGQRQANLMLKFEPADHPFIVKCGRLVGGGVDKDHLGAWYVPHFMMDGFCFYLATASNGQPLRDFDFWTDALSPVWMEVLLNAMTEAGAFSGQPFSRWATEAVQSLRGFALTRVQPTRLLRECELDDEGSDCDLFCGSSGQLSRLERRRPHEGVH